MTLDMERVIRDMAAAISESVRDEAGEIGEVSREILESKRRSLDELARARLAGEIDDAVVERELERERRVVEAELLGLEIMTRAMAQRAANAARDTFVAAISTVLRSSV